MLFVSRSFVIISVLGLLASTSAKPTYLRKGHDKQTVSTKPLRQFDPRKVPTRRTFGAAARPSSVPNNGFWGFDGTSEGAEDGYGYDFWSASGNTLSSGPDDTQASNANSNIIIGAAGGIPRSSTTSSAFPDPADLSPSPVGLAPADAFEASQQGGALGSSSRSASGLIGNLLSVGLAPGSSPSFPGTANRMSTIQSVGPASSSNSPVIDNVATAPSRANRGSSRASSGISSSRRFGLRPATSGSSASLSRIGNVRDSDPTFEVVSGSSPNISPEVIRDSGDLESRSDTPVVDI